MDAQSLCANRDTIERVIRAVAHHYRLSRADAQDFAQEVWLDLLRKDARALRTFRMGSSLETYLWKIASHRWLKCRAKQTLNSSVLEVPSDLCGDASASGSLTEPVFDLSEAGANATCLAQVLDRETMSLPLSDRELLRLRFVQGTDVAAIAQRLDSTPAAIYKRIERLLRKIRGALLAVGFTSADVAAILDSGQFDWSGLSLLAADRSLSDRNPEPNANLEPDPKPQTPITPRRR